MHHNTHAWLSGLEGQIIGAAGGRRDLDAVLAVLAEAWIAADLAPAGVSLSVVTAHPALALLTYVWTRTSGEVKCVERPLQFLQSTEHLTSPVHTVLSTGARVVLRKSELSTAAASAIPQELAQAGATTYVALPIRSEAGDIHVLATWTDRAPGWDDDMVTMLEGIIPLLGLTIELAESRRLKYAGAPAMAADTSLRRRAEQDLLDANTRLKATLEALPDLLFEVDSENIIRRYHAPLRQALFVEPEVFIGRSVRDVLPPHAAEVIEGALEKAREQGHHTGASYSLLMPQGERWFELSVARKGTGLEREVVALARDITDLKQAQEARLEHERKILHTQKLESLGVLAGGIAHDFNNMLTVVMGNISLAMTTLAPTSLAYGSLLAAETATERAAALSRQMLAYSGKGRFLVKTVRLVDVVEEMVQLLQVSISKRARLRLDFAPDAPPTQVDVTQLRQIILNLVTNASDAIGDQDGVISISTGAMHCDRAYLDAAQIHQALPEGVYTYLEVSDTGSGIAESDLPKIFDPFFTTKFIGRGLGLSAVQGIVRGHGGTLTVESKLGQFTTFRVLFPAFGESFESDVSELTATTSWRGRGRILLVDDEESIRVTTTAMLELCGFDVVAARDGREAVEIFRAQRDQIVAVLLDLTMPTMDGEETFHALRRIHPSIPVILSSGYGEHEVQRRFAGHGLSAFVAKPYSIATLQTALRRAM